MKVKANDLGVCGVEQLFYAGSIAFNTEDISTGVALCELPHSAIITRAVAVVKTAFNAATTNVVTVGVGLDNSHDPQTDNLLGSSDITEGTAAAYSKQVFVEAKKGDKVYAKYTQTGTAATAGAADIYLFAVGTPE